MLWTGYTRGLSNWPFTPASPLAWTIIPFQNNKAVMFVYWQHGANLAQFNFNPGMESDQMPSEVWDEITYPFLTFNGCTIDVWEWINNFFLHIKMDVISYPSLGLQLERFNKRGSWRAFEGINTFSLYIFHVAHEIREGSIRVFGSGSSNNESTFKDVYWSPTTFCLHITAIFQHYINLTVTKLFHIHNNIA